MSLVKICGLRRLEDVKAANSCMPDYVGFVFADSKRQVDRETAAILRDALNKRIQVVGVFVNQTFEFIKSLCDQGIIQIVQLHGDESEAYIKALKSHCGCLVIKAVSVGNALPKLPENPDYLLFDTLSGQRGGTGKIFDWKLLEGQKKTPYFLAGGLCLDNVAEAMKTLNPFCVDISSGVETDGWKDPDKMQIFVDLVRGIL